MRFFLLICIVLFFFACKGEKNKSTKAITDSLTEYLTDTACCNRVVEDCNVTKSKCCVSDSTAIKEEPKKE